MAERDCNTAASTEAAAARILIVDDEDYIRNILSRWLGSEGYQCTPARDAEEALAILGEDDGYQLLISDIMMPGKSGINLLEEVRERFAGLAVIMATGLDKRDVAIRTLQLGAYGYVIKPFDKNELIISVAGALERRRLTVESRAYQERLRQEVRDRTADIRGREEEIALRLVSASEYRDEETGSHIRRMGAYSAALASALGWDSQTVDMIRVAAPMHDVGKIGVSDNLLLKPGRLTPEEFEKIKEHAVIGAKILGGSDIPLLQMATDIALYHHEKWDGSGYVHGLAGEEIPAAARIVAVADVYDALSNDRVYRKALPEEKVLAIMSQGRGSHFDPAVFDCFLELVPAFRDIREKGFLKCDN
ncbi:MAG: response regulator [Desulfobacteraceae bacterium]|nr:response regulator [Desulfobacteraceae bacterium]